MNNQQPYLLPLGAAYGLNGFGGGLVSLASSPAQLAPAAGQLGKLAGLPLAPGQPGQQGGGYPGQNPALGGVTMCGQVPGVNGVIPGLTAGQLSSLPLSLSAAGMYPIMSPSLSPYQPQLHTQNIAGLSQNILAANGLPTNIPKIFVPSVKVS